jgi:hypothetical protein
VYNSIFITNRLQIDFKSIINYIQIDFIKEPVVVELVLNLNQFHKFGLVRCGLQTILTPNYIH